MSGADALRCILADKGIAQTEVCPTPDYSKTKSLLAPGLCSCKHQMHRARLKAPHACLSLSFNHAPHETRVPRSIPRVFLARSLQILPNVRVLSPVARARTSGFAQYIQTSASAVGYLKPAHNVKRMSPRPDAGRPRK